MPTLIAKPHPLRSDTFRTEVPVGSQLSEILGDVQSTVHAQVNGEVWPRERWEEALPEGLVTIYSTPQDDDAGRVIGMIAIAALAYYTGGLATSWAGSATGLGLSANAAGAVGAAISAATTPPGALAINLEQCP